MARSGLRKFDVKQARDSLVAQGKTPSVDAVRIELGNTGSKSTIHKYLKEIEKEESGDTPRQAETGGSLHELVEQLAAKLHAETNARVDALRARHAEEITSLEKQNEALRLELYRAGNGTEGAPHAFASKAAVPNTLEEQLAELKYQMSTELRRLRDALESRPDNIAVGRDQGRLAADLSQARKTLEERDTQIAEIRNRLQQSTNESESLRRQMHAMQIELAATQARLNTQQAIMADLLFHSGDSSAGFSKQRFKEASDGMFGGSRSSDWSWTRFDTSLS